MKLTKFYPEDPVFLLYFKETFNEQLNSALEHLSVLLQNMKTVKI